MEDWNLGMAAPSLRTTGLGVTDAGGAWTYASTGALNGDFVVFQVLQDGATSGAIALTSAGTDARDLSGTANTATYVGAFAVGGSNEAIQHIWVLRAVGNAIVYSGTNSTSEDLYMRDYEFANVSAGTTLATVIENATAGATVNVTGTSNTAADGSVQTLGVDRLALNFLAINDDNPFAGFTGQSGGTWTTAASYAEASGTDGAIYLATAAMASAGTIDGGTGSITDSDAWGVVGFALIGTTVEIPPRRPPYPQLLAH
jgi:hypothetical protein